MRFDLRSVLRSLRDRLAVSLKGGIKGATPSMASHGQDRMSDPASPESQAAPVRHLAIRGNGEFSRTPSLARSRQKLSSRSRYGILPSLTQRGFVVGRGSAATTGFRLSLISGETIQAIETAIVALRIAEGLDLQGRSQEALHAYKRAQALNETSRLRLANEWLALR